MRPWACLAVQGAHVLTKRAWPFGKELPGLRSGQQFGDSGNQRVRVEIRLDRGDFLHSLSPVLGSMEPSPKLTRRRPGKRTAKSSAPHQMAHSHPGSGFVLLDPVEFVKNLVFVFCHGPSRQARGLAPAGSSPSLSPRQRAAGGLGLSSARGALERRARRARARPPGRTASRRSSERSHPFGRSSCSMTTSHSVW